MSETQHRDVVILQSDEVARIVARIAHQIIEKTALDSPGAADVMLLGIPSGGVPLAQRICAKIAEFTDVTVPVGSLDVTLYRDDLRSKPHRALLPTNIPEPGVDGTVVILVDDVLFSGRTIAAALDALKDIGRPASIQLAALIDRGHREVPIRADYVGKNLPTAQHEDVRVLAHSVDGEDKVILTRAPGSEN
ncbi:MAG: bifunctional pyr operon transcriptional regulator/uracil phosphoribosyltransferase PyrR [Corynebacterium sp.]|nr:bifunctional pyr operon transcriptional regulator/uracil phosphoribosyltransferase PyrR [Corynebacterium sp.]